jgi:threonyl-tRNA synthetase
LPIHVRVIPVSDKHLDPALELVRNLAHKNIRVDIDDRLDAPKILESTSAV